MIDFDEGFLLGLLIGEGHFGGDGRQPQVTLRMHARHETLFRWLERAVPGGRLYGPYDHGGRHYYQWMVRGACLRDVLLPLLERRLTPTLDHYAYDRYAAMRTTYARQLGLGPSEAAGSGPSEPADHLPAESAADLATRTGATDTPAIFSRLRDQLQTELHTE